MVPDLALQLNPLQNAVNVHNPEVLALLRGPLEALTDAARRSGSHLDRSRREELESALMLRGVTTCRDELGVQFGAVGRYAEQTGQPPVYLHAGLWAWQGEGVSAEELAAICRTRLEGAGVRLPEESASLHPAFARLREVATQWGGGQPGAALLYAAPRRAAVHVLRAQLGVCPEGDGRCEGLRWDLFTALRGWREIRAS